MVTPRRIVIRAGASAQRSAHERGALRAIELWLESEGLELADLVDLALESQLRARAQLAHRTGRGDELGTYPDAQVTIAADVQQRAGQPRTVAIELISRKYSDAMILKKGALRARFKEVVFFGDTRQTAARVERLLGEPCRCI